MAIYLTNISVDTPDPAAHYFCEDLEYNDVESVAEFVLEQVLCIEDAVPEHEDPDREDDASKKGKTILLALDAPLSPLSVTLAEPAHCSKIPTSTDRPKAGRTPEIISPPPQA